MFLSKKRYNISIYLFGDYMIIVLAKAIPKDEEACEKIVEFAQDLIENSRKEEGNVDYNLYVNTGDQTLMFVEQWESKEILAAHLQTEHFLKFGENIADLVAGDLAIDVFNAEATDL